MRACSGFTQPLSSVPEALLTGNQSRPLLWPSLSCNKYLPSTCVPWGGGWDESKAPDLKELPEWGEPLLQEPRGHSWGRNAGEVWGPGPEMFRLSQKESKTRYPAPSPPSVDLGGT